MALTRTRHKMPDYICAALTERKLMNACYARPDYQQNDYIGSLCVTRAKRKDTKQKRLAHTCPGRRCREMLEEIESGKLYMQMKWNPK